MTGDDQLGALFGAAETTTFLGLEACDDLGRLSAPTALIGAPCATPYASVGAYCRNAPRAIRKAAGSLSANITHCDFDLGGPIFPEDRLRAADCGDLPYDEADAPANRDRIREAVEAIAGRAAVPIVLGGDDSVPIPMLEALAAGGPLTILQIDAHIDWRDAHMGERMGLSSTMRRASEMAHVERIIQVGARGVGSARPQDVQDALDWGASLVTARELHERGVGAALSLIPEGARIAICLDVDALDPSVMPGVIARCPGGLSYTQVLALLQGAAAKGRIAAMDLVELLPERDVDGLGAQTAARIVASAMGVIARQAMTR